MGILRGDYLYTCRLKRAYQDYVDVRKSCVQASDCVFVPGVCPIPSAVVNESYASRVRAIRDQVFAAYSLVAVTKCCGGDTRQAASPSCVAGSCQ